MSFKLFIPILTLSALIFGACSAPSPESASTPSANPTSFAPNQATDSTQITTKVYSLEEVAKHNLPLDCWLAIDGKVYDVSDFGTKHPGEEAVYRGCGLDATTLFETRPMGSKTPHSDKARSFLPNFYIGELAP